MGIIRPKKTCAGVESSILSGNDHSKNATTIVLIQLGMNKWEYLYIPTQPMIRIHLQTRLFPAGFAVFFAAADVRYLHGRY
jgi:hypothetical protein